jgi:hypothetical protein
MATSSVVLLLALLAAGARAAFIVEKSGLKVDIAFQSLFTGVLTLFYAVDW